MAMPEAAVHEYAGAVFAQHKVGVAGQAVVVETIAESVGVQVLTHYDFRLGAFAAYVLHA